MKTSGYIMVTQRFYREKNKWVAVCVELGTSTFGRTKADAHKKLIDAVLCHLNALEEVGERARFFKENKIKFYAHKPTQKEIEVKIPTKFLLDNKSTIESQLQPVPA